MPFRRPGRQLERVSSRRTAPSAGWATSTAVARVPMSDAQAHRSGRPGAGACLRIDPLRGPGVSHRPFALTAERRGICAVNSCQYTAAAEDQTATARPHKAALQCPDEKSHTSPSH
ncbi:hypothetical protein SKAU_G00007190 [Synaphobranchus kaupii]|uniref:Uncharacterized protein n=1 Tax=Synaphobranchus kaupii TaxID=118154 RepID=A0A9Q1GAI4_SYNKA|nr:hypothetical protein SKAU_G00007190 [Synaphobranchus kaupii]